MPPILETRGLTTTLSTADGERVLVEGVDLTVEAGERVALVGESGSGKSLTVAGIIRLLTDWRLQTSGEVIFNGTDLMRLSDRQMQQIRGNRIGFVPQDPMTALNPTLTVGHQLIETLRIHLHLGAAEARSRAIALLDQVQISRAAERLGNYPHQFSGGMRQRVLIALAMSCGPDLVIADEATSALDVTTQAQVMALIKDLCESTGAALLFVTHNLSLVAAECSKVYVMYAGQIVEFGAVADLYHRQLSPYSRLLLSAVPDPRSPRKSNLVTIEGLPLPPQAGSVDFCRFNNRCPHVRERCRTQAPPLSARSADRAARCWGSEQGSGWIDEQEG